MSVINKGTSFSNGEQLTANKINNLLDLATFNQSATDSASTTVNSDSQIIVQDSGITTAKLATDAVETAKIKDANVTKAKIEDVADYKVLGNVSGSAAAPAEVAILDEDDMVSNSDTALATQQSIKTYVDASAQTFVPASYAGEGSVTFPNGFIMKFGTVTSNGNVQSFTFQSLVGSAFPTACLNLQGQRSTISDSAQNLSYTSLSSTGWTMNPNGSGTYSWTAFGH
jgi:hypothetical protein